MTTEPEVWLITGGSSGMGRALARAALCRGHIVVAGARNTAAMATLGEGCEDRFLPLELDVLDQEQIVASVDATVERYGRIDVLVNNAGMFQIGAVEELSDAELRRMFDLHVFGPAALVRAVLPLMRERRHGTIVQMSSMGAFLIDPGSGAYTASKAALEGLSAALCKEVEPFGIRVVIVEPGGFRTEVFAQDRAGRSVANDAYASTVGASRDYFDRAHGTQPGDPALAAETIVDVVAMERPPLRLPLGTDAVREITSAIAAIDDNVRRWGEVAAATGFGGRPASLPPEG